MKNYECMYEVATLYHDTGEIVRGGLKAPLEKATEWAQRNNILYGDDPFSTFIVVEANEEAITEEEYWKEYSDDTK